MRVTRNARPAGTPTPARTDAENLEDRMTLLGQPAAAGPEEQEVSLRLLRHYASSVRHCQYHDTDVVTVRVESAQAQA